MSSTVRQPSVSRRLPDFPWDQLDGVRRARARPPRRHRRPLGRHAGRPDARGGPAARCADAADAPGYPTTIGLAETRQAALDWLARRFGVTGLGLDAVLPVIGSKELIAALPAHLGIGAGDLVVYPELAYPTYEVGAALAGARAVATDSLTALGPRDAGAGVGEQPVQPDRPGAAAEHLKKVVDWCRERGALLVSDECYLECAWEDPAGLGAAPRRSAAGRPRASSPCTRCPSGPTSRATAAPSWPVTRRVVGELLAVRKNLGLMMPAPQQRAMVAALDDDEHVVEQHARYAARRAKLREALLGRGLPDRPLRGVALPLGDPRRGLLGHRLVRSPTGASWSPRASFYGRAGSQHVRVAFTATDERIDAAVARLT